MSDYGVNSTGPGKGAFYSSQSFGMADTLKFWSEVKFVGLFATELPDIMKQNASSLAGLAEALYVFNGGVEFNVYKSLLDDGTGNRGIKMSPQLIKTVLNWIRPEDSQYCTSKCSLNSVVEKFNLFKKKSHNKFIEFHISLENGLVKMMVKLTWGQKNTKERPTEMAYLFHYPLNLFA